MEVFKTYLGRSFMLEKQQGPFADSVNRVDESVVRKEVTTYRNKDGLVYKDCAIRTYTANGHYNDSVSSVVVSTILF